MENQAAYILSPKARLQIKPSPLPQPGPNEVLIRNDALSINPIDIVQQDMGITVPSYPHIPGIDVAGIVSEIGEGVIHFKKGDRVAAISIYLRTQNPAYAAFQLYTVVPAYLVSRIPDAISLTEACVLPLALATAAAGLYQPEYLGLTPPTGDKEKLNKDGDKEKAILIWGGSSSVGSCCIQLCVASGLTVLTTASSKNHEYVKDLGAHYVFDHHAEDIVKQLIDTAAGRTVVGVYDAISSRETAMKCAEFLHAAGGGMLFATRASEFASEEILLGDIRRIAGHPPGSSDAGEPPVWMKIWADCMGEGLETGKFRAKPEPVVVKGGLEKLQVAMDLYREGVSAAKIVVKL